jgi:hypothetical protein
MLGVIAGILLGLGIIALASSASSGLNPFITQASNGPTSLPPNGTSGQYVITITTSRVPVLVTMTGTTSTASARAASVYSNFDNIARQPITLIGFVLLPVFAALLFGFVVYRISRVRNEREETPGAA